MTPTLTSNASLIPAYTLTDVHDPLHIAVTTLIVLSSTQGFLVVHYSSSLGTLSYAVQVYKHQTQLLLFPQILSLHLSHKSRASCPSSGTELNCISLMCLPSQTFQNSITFIARSNSFNPVWLPHPRASLLSRIS